MSDFIIMNGIACTRPTTRLGMKHLTLLAKRENVRRTPALWAMLPNHDKAADRHDKIVLEFRAKVRDAIAKAVQS